MENYLSQPKRNVLFDNKHSITSLESLNAVVLAITKLSTQVKEMNTMESFEIIIMEII